MNSKTVSGLVLPVALLLIVAGLGTGYFLWTESREIFFASRYFRLLDRISDHVEQGMAGRRAVMFSALSGADVTNLATLQHQPDFVLPGDFVEQLTRAQKSNPPVDPVATRTTLTRRQEGGRHWLVASFAGQITNGGSERGRATFEVKTDLVTLVERITAQWLASPFRAGSRFDYLLVTDGAEQQLLFAPRGASGQVGSLEEIRDAAGTVTPLELRAEATDVVFAGRRYKLFVRPLHVQLDRLSAGTQDLEEEWRIAGLVASDRFRSASLAIHYGLLATAVFVSFGLLLAYPLFEVRFLGSRDSLGRIRVSRLFLSVVLFTSLATLGMTDCWGYGSARSVTDEQLDTLGRRIKDAFLEEKQQLDAVAERLSSAAVLESVVTDPKQGETRIWKTQPWMRVSEETDVIAESLAPVTRSLDLVAWINAEGRQVAKWSVRNHLTPFVGVRGRAYFQQARRSAALSDNPTPGTAIEIIQSMTTGETTVAVSRAIADPPRVSPPVDEPTPDRPAVVVVIARMTSIIAPVLPDGYRFAILDHDGTVLLHSDPAHGQGDNFIEEAENDHDLLAALQGHDPTRLNMSYEGEFQRVRLVPLTDTWFLAVMRNTRPMHSSNLQVLWVTTIIVTGGFVAIFLVLFVLQHLLKVRLEWMLQTDTPGPRYVQLIVGYLIVLVGFFAALTYWPAGKLFLLGVIMAPLFIMVAYRGLARNVGTNRGWLGFSYSYHRGWLDPLIVALMTATCLLGAIGNRNTEHGVISALVVACHVVGLLWAAKIIHRNPGGQPAQPMHRALAGCLFLTLLAVVPTMTTYRIVADSEVQRFARNVQTQMVRSLEERARRLEDRAGEIELPQDGRARFQAAVRPDNARDVYTDIFLDTTAELRPCPGSCTEQDRQIADLSRWLTFSTHWLLDQVNVEFDAHSVFLSSVARSRVDDDTLVGDEPRPWSSRQLVTRSRGAGVDPAQALVIESTLPSLPWYSLLISLVLSSAPLFVVVGFLSRRLVPSDLAYSSSDVAPELPAIPPDRHTLVLGRGEWRTKVEDSAQVDYIDLAQVDWSRLDGGWPRARNWSDDGNTKAIFLDHLDVRPADAEANARKLQLVQLLLESRRTVIIATEVAPEELVLRSPEGVNLGGERDLQARWELLFRRCQRVYLDADQRSNETALSHHERLWRSSSPSERALLLRLSETGVVNVQRDWAAKRLVSRGVLLHGPLRLAPSLDRLDFNQFIQLPHHRREVAAWETAGESGKKWRLWRWVPLFSGAVLGLFLLSTQEELRMTLAQVEGVGAVAVSIITSLSLVIPRLRRAMSGLGES